MKWAKVIDGKKRTGPLEGLQLRKGE